LNLNRLATWLLRMVHALKNTILQLLGGRGPRMSHYSLPAGLHGGSLSWMSAL
jgi:hypothetical protein